jgi:hypothetical protein
MTLLFRPPIGILNCFMAIAVSLLCMPAYAQEASIAIDVQEKAIQIWAKEARLDDILQILAKKMDLTLSFMESLPERVSCDHTDTSVEAILKRLLPNRSYSLVYREAGEGRFVPSELKILGQRSPEAAPVLATTVVMPVERSNNLDRVWYGRTFEAGSNLMEQIAADPVYGEALPNGGLHIRELSEDSAFAQLGLAPGEVVSNVNGKPISSAQDLIEALQSVSLEHPIIRIERWRGDMMFDPIYLELQ